jgi:hypothetical protein
MKEWSIYLSVPYSTLEQWCEINKIAREIDNNDAGSGTGFGQRDIDWYKPTKKEAVKLKNKLLSAFKAKGFEPEVNIWEI